MDSADFDHQFLVADHPSTRRALRRGVVSSGAISQPCSDSTRQSTRPELTTHNSRHPVVAMLVDELHDAAQLVPGRFPST
jgi:hypothetical protein